MCSGVFFISACDIGEKSDILAALSKTDVTAMYADTAIKGGMTI